LRWGDSLTSSFALFCFSGYFHGLAALELTGPGAVSGLWGGSVSVPCQYHERYQETPKYWCSGIIWQSCSKVVETTGSEAEVKRDTVSIRDNHTLYMFTVTMENLTLGDTGIYWCGINLRSLLKGACTPCPLLKSLPLHPVFPWLPSQNSHHYSNPLAGAISHSSTAVNGGRSPGALCCRGQGWGVILLAVLPPQPPKS
uniref:Immunoglobulin V-set domain-containing protein n=1 Tax=Chelonoidis abingdonii TaxID=106734 RepID=A0A8C0GYP9_CHEAB